MSDYTPADYAADYSSHNPYLNPSTSSSSFTPSNASFSAYASSPSPPSSTSNASTSSGNVSYPRVPGQKLNAQQFYHQHATLHALEARPHATGAGVGAGSAGSTQPVTMTQQQQQQQAQLQSASYPLQPAHPHSHQHTQTYAKKNGVHFSFQNASDQSNNSSLASSSSAATASSAAPVRTSNLDSNGEQVEEADDIDLSPEERRKKQRSIFERRNTVQPLASPTQHSVLGISEEDAHELQLFAANAPPNLSEKHTRNRLAYYKQRLQKQRIWKDRQHKLEQNMTSFHATRMFPVLRFHHDGDPLNGVSVREKPKHKPLVVAASRIDNGKADAGVGVGGGGGSEVFQPLSPRATFLNMQLQSPSSSSHLISQPYANASSSANAAAGGGGASSSSSSRPRTHPLTPSALPASKTSRGSASASPAAALPANAFLTARPPFRPINGFVARAELSDKYRGPFLGVDLESEHALRRAQQQQHQQKIRAGPFYSASSAVEAAERIEVDYFMYSKDEYVKHIEREQLYEKAAHNLQTFKAKLETDRRKSPRKKAHFTDALPPRPLMIGSWSGK